MQKLTSTTFAGPFLRYGNLVPGRKTYTLSVLFLTKNNDTDTNSLVMEDNETEKRKQVSQQPPVLILRDPGPSYVAIAPKLCSTDDDDDDDDKKGHNYAYAERMRHTSSPTIEIESIKTVSSDGNDGGEQHKNSINTTTPMKITGELLDTILGWNFWRFDLSLVLGSHQRQVQYSIQISGNTTSTTQLHVFHLPASNQPYHWGYFSCNGFSLDIPNESFAKRDPTYMWRDLLAVHAASPLHVLVGGGDQVYSDRVWKESARLQEWAKMDSIDEKINVIWTEEMRDEATRSYLGIYLDNYLIKEVSKAYASIPTVFCYDDHDIFDGYGSYHDDLQQCPVFQGLFAVAKRFYLLFQQHTTEERLLNRDSQFFLPHAPGYHRVCFLGPRVALFVIDMRTTRTKDLIMPDSVYTMIETVATNELPESIDHVVFMSGVPVLYPTIPLSETILKGLDSLFRVSKLARCFGRAINLMDRFDQPEILDDLRDGWMASEHKQERHRLIRLLQSIALKKRVRVTIISGDAHVAGVGQLYSRPKRPPAIDPLYMAQIISSAIMNAPPPKQVVRTLLRLNVATNIDRNTRQKMVRAFWPSHPRFDKLLGARNWCDVTVMGGPPYSRPMNPSDPYYGGLRFSIRAEDPNKWYGYAEEVYDVAVPKLYGATNVDDVGRRRNRWAPHLHHRYTNVSRQPDGEPVLL